MSCRPRSCSVLLFPSFGLVTEPQPPTPLSFWLNLFQMRMWSTFLFSLFQSTITVHSSLKLHYGLSIWLKIFWAEDKIIFPSSHLIMQTAVRGSTAVNHLCSHLHSGLFTPVSFLPFLPILNSFALFLFSVHHSSWKYGVSLPYCGCVCLCASSSRCYIMASGLFSVQGSHDQPNGPYSTLREGSDIPGCSESGSSTPVTSILELLHT